MQGTMCLNVTERVIGLRSAREREGVIIVTVWGAKFEIADEEEKGASTIIAQREIPTGHK